MKWAPFGENLPELQVGVLTGFGYQKSEKVSRFVGVVLRGPGGLRLTAEGGPGRAREGADLGRHAKVSQLRGTDSHAGKIVHLAGGHRRLGLVREGRASGRGP